MLSYRLENKLHYNPKVGIMGQNQEDLKKLKIEPVGNDITAVTFFSSL